MTIAIKVENLGKKYIIGHEKQERYSTLRDSLAHSTRSFRQRLRHPNIATFNMSLYSGSQFYNDVFPERQKKSQQEGEAKLIQLIVKGCVC